MKEIFVSSAPATLKSIIGLMTVIFSAEGSSRRQQVEEAYAQFMDILEEIYTVCIILRNNAAVRDWYQNLIEAGISVV